MNCGLEFGFEELLKELFEELFEEVPTTLGVGIVQLLLLFVVVVPSATGDQLIADW